MSDIKVEVAQQHVYTPSVSSAPLYRYKQVNPNTQYTVSATNVTTAQFDVPLEVINLSKSYIQFDLNMPDGADMTDAKFQTVMNSALQPIRAMLLKGSNSSYDFMNIQNMQAFSRMIPYELSDKEFNDLYEDGVADTKDDILYSNGFGWKGLEHHDHTGAVTTLTSATFQTYYTAFEVKNPPDAPPANVVANVVKTSVVRIPNAQIDAAGAVVETDPLYVPGDRTINRIIRQKVATAHNGSAAFVIRYRIPFWLLKNSICSLDKDIYTANERLQLEVQMSPLSDYILIGDDVTDLSGSAITSDEAKQVTISNFYCQFAQQDNRAIAEQIKSLVNTVGIHIPFHYVTQTRFVTAAATDFRYSSTLRGDQGSFCHCVYNLICPQTDDVKGRSNVYNVADSQWVNRRSQVNGMYLQDTTQSTYQEWMALKCNNHNGIINRYEMFQENAVILDRFDATKSDPHSLTGLPLQVGKATDYSIDITTASAAARTYWCQPVFIRTLHLSFNGVSVSS